MIINDETLSTLGFAFNRSMYYAKMLEGIIDSSIDYHTELLHDVYKELYYKSESDPKKAARTYTYIQNFNNHYCNTYENFKQFDWVISNIKNTSKQLDSKLIQLGQLVTWNDYIFLSEKFKIQLNYYADQTNIDSNLAIDITDLNNINDLPNNKIYHFDGIYYIKINDAMERISSFNMKQYDAVRYVKMTDELYKKLKKIQEIAQKNESLVNFDCNNGITLFGTKLLIEDNTLKYSIDGTSSETINIDLVENVNSYNIKNYFNTSVSFTSDKIQLDANVITIPFESGKFKVELDHIDESNPEIFFKESELYNGSSVNTTHGVNYNIFSQTTPITWEDNNEYRPSLTDGVRKPSIFFKHSIWNSGGYSIPGFVKSNFTVPAAKFDIYKNTLPPNPELLKLNLYFNDDYLLPNLKRFGFSDSVKLYKNYVCEVVDPTEYSIWNMVLALPNKYIFTEIEPKYNQSGVESISLDYLKTLEDTNKASENDYINYGEMAIDNINFNYDINKYNIQRIEPIGDIRDRRFTLISKNGENFAEFSIKRYDDILEYLGEKTLNGLKIYSYGTQNDKTIQLVCADNNSDGYFRKVDADYIINTLYDNHVEYYDDGSSTYIVNNYAQTYDGRLLHTCLKDTIINFKRIKFKQELKFNEDDSSYTEYWRFFTNDEEDLLSVNRKLNWNTNEFVFDTNVQSLGNNTLEVTYKVLTNSENNLTIKQTVNYDTNLLSNIYYENSYYYQTFVPYYNMNLADFNEWYKNENKYNETEDGVQNEIDYEEYLSLDTIPYYLLEDYYTSKSVKLIPFTVYSNYARLEYYKSDDNKSGLTVNTARSFVTDFIEINQDTEFLESYEDIIGNIKNYLQTNITNSGTSNEIILDMESENIKGNIKRTFSITEDSVLKIKHNKPCLDGIRLMICLQDCIFENSKIPIMFFVTSTKVLFKYKKIQITGKDPKISIISLDY